MTPLYTEQQMKEVYDPLIKLALFALDQAYGDHAKIAADTIREALK